MLLEGKKNFFCRIDSFEEGGGNQYLNNRVASHVSVPIYLNLIMTLNTADVYNNYFSYIVLIMSERIIFSELYLVCVIYRILIENNIVFALFKLLSLVWVSTVWRCSILFWMKDASLDANQTVFLSGSVLLAVGCFHIFSLNYNIPIFFSVPLIDPSLAE